MESTHPSGVEIQGATPTQHVEHAVVRFLKSRLPGEKTDHHMHQVDTLVSHLPENGQELAAKIRPVIKAGMYAGNVVGTYYEAMLAASVGLGVVLIGKEGLRMIPVSAGSTEMKRKGLAGVWKDLNLRSAPKSLGTAVGVEIQAIRRHHRRLLGNIFRKKPLAEPTPPAGPIEAAPSARSQELLRQMLALPERFRQAVYNLAQASRAHNDAAVGIASGDIGTYGDDIQKMTDAVEAFLRAATDANVGELLANPPADTHLYPSEGSEHFAPGVKENPYVKFFLDRERVMWFVKALGEHLFPDRKPGELPNENLMKELEVKTASIGDPKQRAIVEKLTSLLPILFNNPYLNLPKPPS